MAVRELKMLRKLDHPNIVKLEESFANEKKNELVMILEYCPCKFIFVSLAYVCRWRPAKSNFFIQKVG